MRHHYSVLMKESTVFIIAYSTLAVIGSCALLILITEVC